MKLDAGCWLLDAEYYHRASSIEHQATNIK